MENASKALIIAGAILLSILLISLGVMIFNQAQDTVTGSGMNQAEITSFNNKFLKYEGKQKGTMVKSMVQEVLANNSTAEGTDNAKVQVTYVKSASQRETSETPATSSIRNNNTYTVSIGYESGRVKTITVEGSFM